MKPPAPLDIAEYWIEAALNGNPEEFYDHFAANGWMVGKVPMKDWNAAARNWSRNEAKWGKIPTLPADDKDGIAARQAESDKLTSAQQQVARELAEMDAMLAARRKP